MKMYTQFQIVTFLAVTIILSVLLFYDKLLKHFPNYVLTILFLGPLIIAMIFLSPLKTKSSVKPLDYKQAVRPKKWEIFFIIFLLISWIAYGLVDKIESWKIMLLAIGGLLSYYIYFVYIGNLADQFKDNIDKNR